MMAICGRLELLRICCIPDFGIHVAMAAKAPGLPENVVGFDGTSLHPQFHSSRVTSAFVVDLYVGLPPPEGGGRVGISPVKLTNHFLEANPPHTLTLDRRLIVYAADRRSPRC